MSDVTDYMKMEWDDIHHSRNQDWKILQVIGVLVAAIIAVKLRDINVSPIFLTNAIIIVILLNFVGWYVAIAHYIIFRSKLQQIKECENLLDFAYNPKRFRFYFEYGYFSVQQMIMLIYAGIISALVTWLLQVWGADLNMMILIPLPLFMIMAILSLYKEVSLLRKFIKKPKATGSIDQRVFVAHEHDYVNCLGFLGQRPLKLIANQLFRDEIEWEGGEWSFGLDGQAVKDKKVLLDPKDKVQFSIANEFSKQDRHLHKSTLEIYISDFPMELETKEEGIQHCEKGIFIVPPGVGHKIKLSGSTYVLQVMHDDVPIDKDKKTVSF